MKINLIAVSNKMPAWINTGFEQYQQRLPKECELILTQVPAIKRSKTTNPTIIKAQEWLAIKKHLPRQSYVIALDEHGKQWSTNTLATELQQWQNFGKNICIIIGGADGLAPDCLAAAEQIRSLSKLTLPHPLVRIVIAEQIYRAFSWLNNHPYHRG